MLPCSEAVLVKLGHVPLFSLCPCNYLRAGGFGQRQGKVFERYFECFKIYLKVMCNTNGYRFWVYILLPCNVLSAKPLFSFSGFQLRGFRKEFRQGESSCMERSYRQRTIEQIICGNLIKCLHNVFVKMLKATFWYSINHLHLINRMSHHVKDKFCI